MAAHDVLVIFGRFPQPGATKTRLALAIGDDAAAALYRAFLGDLARRFARVPFAVRWAVAPPDPGFAALVGVAPADCVAQSGGDLGARMHATFIRMCADAFRRMIIIGSDSPQIPLATVERAFELLDDRDVVLGPAEDGGYYLIGMSEPHDLFSGIEWSSPRVLGATRERAAALGLSLAELETSFDVDRASDLDRLRKLVSTAGGRALMPATAAAIGAIPRGRGDSS